MISYFEKHLSRLLVLVFSVDFLILLATAGIALKIMNSAYFSSDLKFFYVSTLHLVAFILFSHMMLFINELYCIEKKFQKKLLVFKCIFSFMIVSISSVF